MPDTPLDRWLRGDCLCCGADLDWWPDTDPEPVAEGVMMCGRCIANEHHLRPPEVLASLLAALVTGKEVA
jgi:hypothetical protein